MLPQTLVLEFRSLKRTRRYGSKVNTGCLTCKSRRIKCDETKPKCLRCTSTRRVCGGYVAEGVKPPARSSLRPASPLRDTLLSQPWLEEGLPYLEFYYHCAIESLSNRFDNGFWSRTVLQIARSEPCIQHALVALGYLVKRESGSLKHAHARLKTHDQTLSHYYNKAIGSLVKRLAEHAYSMEVGLVACLLFVCIEFLRGDFMNAFSHLHSGIAILSELPVTRTHGLRSRLPQPIPSTSDPKLLPEPSAILQDTLIPMFMRSITPAMLFGAPIEKICEIPIPDASIYNQPFSTFHGLQMSSFQLRNASALFARTVATKIFVKAPLTPDDIAQRSQLLAAHHAWFRAFRKLEQAASLTHDEEVMAAALKLGYYSTYILIDCSLSLNQSKFDAHLDYFKAINHNAKMVLDSMGIATPPLPVSSGTRRGLSRKPASASRTERDEGSSRRGAHFTFEISVIPPLHYVATRCRHPLVRREALALLKTNPPREGLWDVDTHVAVAERVIAIEESELDPTTGWPAEATRLWCSVHDGKGYSDGKILVTFAFAEWAEHRVPRWDDMRPVKGADRVDAQWTERIG